MANVISISNDRQAKEAKARVAELSETLSHDQVFTSLVRGLPKEVVAGFRRSLSLERQQIAENLDAYEQATIGNFVPLKKMAGNDLGSQLIVARIAKGLTQKELARKLGLQEQAIQRYEAERYKSISLSSFQKFASVLNLKFSADHATGYMSEWGLPFEVDHSEVGKVLKHAKASGWLKEEDSSTERALEALKRHVGDHVVKYGTPSLLRTGLEVKDRAKDLSFLVWKAQIARKSEAIIKERKPRYRWAEPSWLVDLVRMSTDESKLCDIPNFLLEYGIVLTFEPQIPGMNVDGAAFLIDETPIIGLTLRNDALDSFWFTLLHEIAHVVLHYRFGLQAGFFDNIEDLDTDIAEEEADNFASNMLIPDEIWTRSPARISKSPEPIVSLARHLNIHPAIVFGRIRMERKNYALFSDGIRRGIVRKIFTGTSN